MIDTHSHLFEDEFKSDLNECIDRCKNNNVNKIILVGFSHETNKKAQDLAKKYDNTGTDLEDLVSIGTIGLIKAVNTYRLDKNIKLATYASRCIDNEILMYLRKTKRKKGEVSFEDSLSYDADGNELHLEDVLGTEKDIVTKGLDEELNRSIMLSEIEKLNKRDKEIIELRYGLNNKKELTQKDVAKLLGISQSYISRIEKKVIKRLKNIIKN